MVADRFSDARVAEEIHTYLGKSHHCGARLAVANHFEVIDRRGNLIGAITPWTTPLCSQLCQNYSQVPPDLINETLF